MSKQLLKEFTNAFEKFLEKNEDERERDPEVLQLKDDINEVYLESLRLADNAEKILDQNDSGIIVMNELINVHDKLALILKQFA